MRLAHLRIENFRGIRTGHVRFEPHTVFVGPNKTGSKTVIIETILYATDYPLALTEKFTATVENGPLSEVDRQKVFHGNARRLFGL